MRLLVLIAALGVATAFASTARSAELENCTRFPEYQQKTDCLYKNEVLLNSVLEVTVSELRKAVQELRDEVRLLKIDVQTLKNSAPDLSGVVRIGSSIQLESLVHFGTCLDHNTQNAGHIQGWACGPGQAWKVNRR